MIRFFRYKTAPAGSQTFPKTLFFFYFLLFQQLHSEFRILFFSPVVDFFLLFSLSKEKKENWLVRRREKREHTKSFSLQSQVLWTPSFSLIVYYVFLFFNVFWRRRLLPLFLLYPLIQKSNEKRKCDVSLPNLDRFPTHFRFDMTLSMKRRRRKGCSWMDAFTNATRLFAQIYSDWEILRFTFVQKPMPSSL